MVIAEVEEGSRQLSKAEFATLRPRLLKLGARVTDTDLGVRLAFAAAFPEDRFCARSPSRCNRPHHERRGISNAPAEPHIATLKRV